MHADKSSSSAPPRPDVVTILAMVGHELKLVIGTQDTQLTVEALLSNILISSVSLSLSMSIVLIMIAVVVKDVSADLIEGEGLGKEYDIIFHKF